MTAPNNHTAKLLKIFAEGCGNGKYELVSLTAERFDKGLVVSKPPVRSTSQLF